MILLGKFSLLILSMTGYILFLLVNCHIRIEFTLAVICAWISNVMFAAGILNIMPQAAWVIFAGGFILLWKICAQSSFQTRSDARCGTREYVPLDRHNILLYGGFLLVIVYFSWLIRGTHFVNYDNFSHWAAVVKNMLFTNRMPNFEDEIIMFQSYPLGSALFIYYICRIIGNADVCYIWAQIFMLVSFLFCMAAFIKKGRLYKAVWMGFFCLWALSANINIHELLVDTLLPLAAAAAFSIIFYYQKLPQKAVYCSSGLLAVLLNIKNSGLYFYVVCVLFLTVYARSYIKQHKLQFAGVSLLFPLGLMYLWKRHVALVFSNGMMSKHAMSLANYTDMVMGKSKEDLKQIGQRLIERVLSFEGMELKMMLLMTAILVLACLRKKTILRTAGMALVIWICAGIYFVFVYAMYIFSMPFDEAQRLASYDRYMMTLIIFLYGVITVYVLEHACITKREVMAGVMLLAFYPVWQCRLQLHWLYQKPDYEAAERAVMQDIIKEYGLESGKSYMIYRTDDDGGYLFYLLQYELWTTGVGVITEGDFEERKQQIGEYDYFIVWDADHNVKQYLEEYGPAYDQRLIIR